MAQAPKPSWLVRGAGLLLLALLLVLLLLLAKQASYLRGELLLRRKEKLAEKAKSLPWQERSQLQAALVCLASWEGSQPPNPAALHEFWQATGKALEDDQLTPEEARQLTSLARQACGSSSP
jgi:hypothetical protein